jgi:peptidoglycan hydrolase CwlO-like protein
LIIRFLLFCSVNSAVFSNFGHASLSLVIQAPTGLYTPRWFRMRVGSTKKGVILIAFHDSDAQNSIVKQLNFVQMTTTEKIKQLQQDVQLLRKQVQDNEEIIVDQKKVMRDLFTQIDRYQSFIPTGRCR